VIWDIGSPNIRTSFDAGECPRSSAFSLDGKLVVTVQDRKASIHRAEDGTLLRPLESACIIDDIRFHPNGRLVIGSAGDRELFWDVATGRCVLTLMSNPPQADGKGGFWIACTPDGYYTGSAGIEQRFTWRVGSKLYAGTTYADRFRRPQLIRDLIAASPK
jgi:WD40 repeat protein